MSDVVVGLMSGTSCDGITAAAVRFGGAPSAPSFELLAWTTTEYDSTTRTRLLAALGGASPQEYALLDVELGERLADAALAVMRAASLAADDVAAVASHGHTIWHVPGRATWQIGNAATIAERTGVDVVNDFRAGDVAAGGQGAPLVPIADSLLFASDELPRTLQNLGGIANVTVVPRRGDDAAMPTAFDTGPGVAVIDGVTRALFPDLPYDVDGELARCGTPSDAIVSALLAHQYFDAPPPKSTGRELFGDRYAADLIARCANARLTPEDAIATAVALTAQSIARAYERWVRADAREVVLSGGGAKNPTLVDAIARALAPRTVRRFDELFFDGEAKEAVAFALMGWLRLHGAPGNVPSATGASGPRVLGSLTLAPSSRRITGR